MEFSSEVTCPSGSCAGICHITLVQKAATLSSCVKKILFIPISGKFQETFTKVLCMSVGMWGQGGGGEPCVYLEHSFQEEITEQ